MSADARRTMTFRGRCHCGAVGYEVTIRVPAVAHRCNCSICRLDDFPGLIVPASAFRLIDGEDVLSEYRFNTGVARHLFCRRCGIKSFYVPRSNPDGFSVNLRCLEPGWEAHVAIEPFDGVHWESHADRLAALSRD